MALNFNDKSEKPVFTYRPNPLVPHSWQLFRFHEEKKEYEPVGDYILLDLAEDIDITEKKVANIVGLLNGGKNIMKLGDLTRKRVLFNMVPKRSENDPAKIIFRSFDGKGVSVENAVLTIEEGVFHDFKLKT